MVFETIKTDATHSKLINESNLEGADYFSENDQNQRWGFEIDKEG